MINNKEFNEKYVFDNICAYSKDASKIDSTALKCFLQSHPVSNVSTLSVLEKAKKKQLNFDLSSIDLEQVHKGPKSKLLVKDYHLDAIRRRCDHDGDEKISFAEFREIISASKFVNK